jgi:hypothetical protein
LVRKIREHFVTARPRETDGGPYNSALHGEPTVALDQSEGRSGELQLLLKTDPRMAALRADRRYQDLLRRMGLPL